MIIPFPTEWEVIKFHGSSHHQPEMFGVRPSNMHKYAPCVKKLPQVPTPKTQPATSRLSDAGVDRTPAQGSGLLVESWPGSICVRQNVQVTLRHVLWTWEIHLLTMCTPRVYVLMYIYKYIFIFIYVNIYIYICKQCMCAVVRMYIILYVSISTSSHLFLFLLLPRA